MFIALRASLKWMLGQVLAELFLKAFMFLGMNVAMQFLLVWLTDQSYALCGINPFNIGEIVNNMFQILAGLQSSPYIAIDSILWGMSIVDLTLIFPCILNAILARSMFELLVRTVR